MGDSEDETFRKLSGDLESDPEFNPPTEAEAQARNCLGDGPYEALVAKNAQDIALDAGLKAASIGLMTSRAKLNRTLASTTKWTARAAVAFGIVYFAIR